MSASERAKVALVTGASNGGIGFHLCQSLSKRGFIVYAAARSLEAMSELAHPNVNKIIVEVTDDEQVEKTIQSIENENEQGLDLVINNTGTYSTGPLIHSTIEHFTNVLDVNVVSILRVCRIVVPYMAKRRKGTIVNVGSIAGYMPLPWAGIYESSKAAVRVLTEVLEMECRPFNIHVVLLEPGAVTSRLTNNFVDYTPPVGSIYSDAFNGSGSLSFIRSIRHRVTVSRYGGMAGDVFAERVVPRLIQPRPPKYIFDGHKWLAFTFLSFLPRLWALNLMYFVMVILQRGGIRQKYQ